MFTVTSFDLLGLLQDLGFTQKTRSLIRLHFIYLFFISVETNWTFKQYFMYTLRSYDRIGREEETLLSRLNKSKKGGTSKSL